MGYRILLVGDAKQCGQSLLRNAVDWNLSVVSAPTATQAMSSLKDIDLALLSLDLPDASGLAWLKMLRQTEPGRELPVLVAADRRSDADMAEAYEWGADDFILKDCDPGELLARIRAVLRRRFERKETAGCAVRVGPVSLDPARHECRVRDRLVPLRPREFELLEILMHKSGRVLNRAYLLETVWGMTREADTRAVDVGISRLRKALGLRAGAWIETIERFGYRFRSG
jgi:DNA-binding response OmpR family regulator